MTVVDAWLPWSLALVGVAFLAPVAAWTARRLGARAKGGLALASILLGFGEVLDPPARRPIEATEDRRDGRRAPGEPPL